MKNIINTILMASLSAAMTACIGNYEEINYDHYGPGSGDVLADDYALGSAMNNLAGCVISPDVNTAQFTDCLLGGTMGGYFADSQNTWTNTISNYNPTDDWTRVFLKSDKVIPVLYTNYNAVKAISEQTGNPVPLAIAKIIKVAAMHRITDTYGAIPYSKIGENGAITTPYDSQEQIYRKFFEELNEAITDLIANENEALVATADYIYSGNVKKWIKFANSLRLRLAMRVSNVDKTLATSEAQKALENSYGVIESSDENIQISGKGYQNPLAGVAGWGETYMGATIASVLNGYEDPRISIYYNPATLAEHTEEYLGVPQGVYAKDGDPNYYQSYSFINTQTITASTPAVLLTAAETWFLRAEASLRGINPKNESAKQCYETGVQTSFSQWGAGDASLYLTSKGKPTDYINYAAGPGKDMKALITITPNFDDAVNQEEQLEKIITQKWIACWPEGMEAWAEQRRTGYPKLFKVQTNNSNGTIDTDIMIRRLPFSQDDAKKDPEQYKNLCTALGGADNGGTRLWWDTGKNNF